MDSITLEASPEQYYYTAVDKMLISACIVLRNLFQTRWRKQFGKDWENSDKQVKKLIEALAKKKLRLTSAEKEKLSISLDEWDITMLFKILKNLWDEVEYPYLVENEAVMQLKRLRNLLAHSSTHTISEQDYDDMKEIFQTSLKALKVKEHDIWEMIDRAEATSIPQEGSISNYEDITYSTSWDDLSSGFRTAMGNTKQAYFQGKVIKLKVLNEHLDLSNVDGRFLSQLAHGDVPCVVNNQVPAELQYYVHRTVKSRSKLKRELFQNVCNDVIVVQGIEKHELTSLVGGQETDVSGNQILRLTVQFILLEHESDLEMICKLASAPVHWIKFSHQNKSYEWVKSSGSVKNLQKYVQETQDSFEEEQLACINLSKNKVTVISDTPGMGKTVLLANIAHYFVRQQPDMLVRFIVLKELVQSLTLNRQKKPIQLDSILTLIAEQSSDFEYGQKLVANTLKCKPCILMFDGFDEVLSQDVNTALMVLKLVSEELSFVHVFVSTRPHMREQVENGLHVLGYTISPFNKADQINFLTRFWNSEGVPINESVHQFAQICLNALSSRITDLERDIAGIPLQCRLLAEVYIESAQRCSRVGYQAYQHSVVVTTSIFEMYDMHMNMRLEKVAAKEHFLKRVMRAVVGRKSQFDAIKDSHMYYAFALLFPDYLREFQDEVEPAISLQQLCAHGIVEDNGLNTPRFIHRTFAEYLVAWLAVEMKPSEKFLSFFLNKLLGTCPSSEYMSTPFGNSNPVASYNFNFPVITYFINGFTKKFEKLKITDFLENNVLTNKVSTLITSAQYNEVARIFTAAAVNDFTHVPLAVTLSYQNLQQSPESPNVSDLLLITAKYCGVELIKTFCSQLDWTDLKFLYSKSGSFYITPLHVAIKRGHYNLVEYLVRFYEHQLNNLRYLLHFCVFESLSDSEAILTDKNQIIKLFTRKSVEWANEKLPDGSTPFMQKNCSLELIECLIGEGADVNTCDKREETLLHKIIDNPLTPESYHRILVALHERGFEHFDKPNFNNVTPLHCAVEKVNLLDETLQLFQSQDADFNAADNAGNSALFFGVRGGRSIPLIRKLIDFGANWNHINKKGRCLLHTCTKYAHYHALEYLVQNFSLNINTDDMRRGWKGHTPLYGAMMKRSKIHEKMQQLLIRNGADLYHKSDSNSNIEFIEAFTDGKGLSLNMINFMEEYGLVITQRLASTALKKVLLNKNILSWEIDTEFTEMFEYLILKSEGMPIGLEFDGNKIPWESEFFRKNLPAVIQATDVSPLFQSLACKYGLLTLNEHQQIKRLSTNIKKSEHFYKLVQEKEGSFEKLCLLSIASNQMNVFVLLRQCFEAGYRDSNMFVTPPPRVIQFINADYNGVITVLTNSLYLGTKRIKEAVGPQVTIIEERDLKSDNVLSRGNVIVVKCRVVTNQLVSKLLLLQSKVICISTAINGELENCQVVSDTYGWEDIGSELIKALIFIVDGVVFRVNELFVTPDILRMLPKNDAFLRDFATHEFASFKIGHEVQTIESGSTYLSSSIFHYILHGKFVFLGIPESELRQFAKFGHSIGHYGDDIENLDYMILEHLHQFEEICSQTKLPVHLIEHQNGRFKLVRTWGFDTKIKTFYEKRKLCNSFPNCNGCTKGDFDQLFVQFSFNNYNRFQNARVAEWETRICELRPRMRELLKLQDTFELTKLGKLLKHYSSQVPEHNVSLTKVEQIACIVQVLVAKLKCESEWKRLQRLAVSKVLPNLTKSVEIVGMEKYEQTGLLKYQDDSLVFADDAVESYIIAELIINSEPCEMLDINYLRTEILDNFFESYELVLPTRRYNMWFSETFGYDSSRIFIYKYSRIFYFLDSLVSTNNYDNPLTNHLKQNLRSDFASKWVFASVYANRFNLLKTLFSIDMQTYFTKWEQLLVLAVKYADIPIIDLVATQYVLQSRKDVRDLEYQLERVDEYFENCITILHVAALRGNYSVMDHLLNTYGFKDRLNQPVLCDILHFCVVDTHNSMILQGGQLNERKRMISLLLRLQPLMINQRDKINRTALLVPNVHVELIIHLINLGVDVAANDKGDHCNIFLHTIPKYLTPEEFDKVVKTLDNLCHSEILNMQKGRWLVTPLYCAVGNFEVLDSTLEIFSSAQVDFNATDAEGETVLIEAVVKRRSMRLLDALVRGGADVHKTGQHDRTVLHVAARYGNLTALRHFILQGSDVNAMDEHGNTPLHLGLESLYNEIVLEVVQVLVRNGAHVNRVGAKQQTPLSLALKRGKREDLGHTIEFLKQAGAR